MIYRRQAAGLLATLAVLVGLPLNAQPAKGNAQEVVSLMMVLRRESRTVHSYVQLYEACAQKPATPDFAAAPHDSALAGRAVGQLGAEWNTLPEAAGNMLAEQCKRRMLKLMGPNGTYYTPAEFEVMRKNGGFDMGLALTRLDGQWVVRETREGSPAAAAGLKSGDVLVSVDGKTVAGLDLSGLVGLLRQPVASPSQLVSQRIDEAPQTRTVARAPITMDKTVVVEKLPGHLYIRLASLLDDTPARLMEGLRGKAVDSNMVRVLDLRGNPGGSLNVMEWVLALLGNHGRAGAWYSVQHRAGNPYAAPYSATESVNRARTPPSAGIVQLREWLVPGRWQVLIDSETNGGASWLASTLRELNGAVLIGQPPESTVFGVDVVQDVKEARGTAGILLEAGLLGLPSGKALALDNVKPDTVLPRTLSTVKPLPKSAAEWLQDPVYLQIKDGLQ